MSSAIFLSTNSDLELLPRDLATGGERVHLQGHADGVSTLAFAPDGRLLASGGHDGNVCLWDLTQLQGMSAPRFPEGQRTSPS